MSRRFPVPILMYHHVERMPLAPPPVFAGSYLSRERFAEHLDRLAAWGRTPLTLGEAVRRWRAGEPLPARPVVLTFDDGCACFAEHAFPELERRGFPATLFALSGELGGSNRWDEAAGERRERLLGAEALAELATAGIEIGSHGHRHLDLRGAAPETLRRELEGSKQRLEAIVGRPVESFCYPFGHFDERASDAARSAGYLCAVGIDEGTRGDDRFALPRMVAGPGDGDLELRLKASGAYRWWRKLPRLGVLSALRRS